MKTPNFLKLLILINNYFYLNLISLICASSGIASSATLGLGLVIVELFLGVRPLV